MMFSTIQVILMPISFGLLFILMLLYWGQAAIFSYTKYSKLTSIIFFLCIVSLTVLLVCRSLDSGHLPLSNLYESLLFLSWSFLVIQLLLQTNSKTEKGFNPETHGIKSSTFQFLPSKGFFLEESKNKVDNDDELRFSLERIDKSCSKDENFLPRSKQTNFHTIGEPEINRDSSELYTSSPLIQDQFMHFLGVVTSPMSLLTYGFAFLNLPKEMQRATSLVPALQSNWLMMHVTIMILSYAALLCGSIFSMAFLFLNFLNRRHYPQAKLVRDLPKKSFGYKQIPYLSKLGFTDTEIPTDVYPNTTKNLSLAIDTQKTQYMSEQKSLFLRDENVPNTVSDKSQAFISLSLAEKLDNYSYRILALGFPLLTVGILSGAVWANQAWGSYWSWDPKESWALITWLVFAVYLHARITKGWSGQRPAIIATLGFFVVWFCYLGVNLLGEGLHTYGWFSK